MADVIAGPVTWYSLSYQCGPSDGKMPSFAFFVDSPTVIVNNPPAGGNPGGLRPPITCESGVWAERSRRLARESSTANTARADRRTGVGNQIAI